MKKKFVKKSKLHDIAFPKCAEYCKVIKLLGASECDSVCPHKFKEELSC